MPELRMPPPARLEDAGLRWSREGDGFLVQRVPTARGALRFALLALLFGGFGAFDVLRGQMLPGALLLALGLLGVAGVLTISRVGVAMRFRPDGSMSWERTGPRAASGHWPSGHVTAARVAVGRQPARWGAHRTIEAQAKVHGEWVTLAWGFDRARAEALVDAMGAALGVPREASVETGR